MNEKEEDHPIRMAIVRVYVGDEGCVGTIGEKDQFPILFRASSPDEIMSKAEMFRADVLEKHEREFQRRSKAAKAARERKEAALRDAREVGE